MSDLRKAAQQALAYIEQVDYGPYDAKPVITALRAALAEPEQPVAWRNAALRVGEDLCSVGPHGYYDMTAEQWLDWALSVVTVHAPPPPAQQQEQLREENERLHVENRRLIDRIETIGVPVGVGGFATTTAQPNKPLTEADVAKIMDFGQYGKVPAYAMNFVRAIEAAHGIGDSND